MSNKVIALALGLLVGAFIYSRFQDEDAELKTIVDKLLKSLGGWFGAATDGETSPTTTNTTPSGNTNEPPSNSTSTVDLVKIRQRLGLNYTMSNDKFIKADNKEGAQVADHARFFYLIDKDYTHGVDQPFGTISICPDIENPWSCSEDSPRANLTRLKALLEMHKGYVFVAPEIIENRSWPEKHLLPTDLIFEDNGDPYRVKYNQTSSMLETLHLLPEADRKRLVCAMGNEDWTIKHDGFVNRCNQAFADAYNDYRHAHKGEACIGISMSAVHVRKRSSAKDTIYDFDSSIFELIEEYNGWLDIHPYPINKKAQFQTGTIDEIKAIASFADALTLAKWVAENHPGIRLYAGEIGYTSSLSNELPTADQRNEDVLVLQELVLELMQYCWLVFIYQYRDHSGIEPLFGGTGIFPHVEPQMIEFAGKTIDRTPLKDYALAPTPYLLTLAA